MLQRSKTLVEKDCINGHRCVAAKDCGAESGFMVDSSWHL